MDAWATIADVQLYTGISVNQENIDSAQLMIELFADAEYNDTIDASGNNRVWSKDIRLLKMAVAYQAAWMTDHPDLFTHVDISSINQDGIFFVQQHDNAMLMSPMTRRALKRVSWLRNNSIKVRPARDRFINKRFVQESLSPEIDVIQPSYWSQI